LNDAFGTAELDTFDVGGSGIETARLAVTRNGGAFLAHTIREFACSRFAGTFKRSCLALVWIVWLGTRACEGTVVWIRLADAHLALAFAAAVGCPPVIASKIVLGDVDTTVPRGDLELANIVVGRTAAEAIGMFQGPYGFALFKSRQTW